MKIQVDWYRRTGKWYTGGEVEIGDTPLWHDDFKQKIVDNQNEMRDGWQGDYFIVTSDTYANQMDDSYRNFYFALFIPECFEGIKKTSI